MKGGVTIPNTTSLDPGSYDMCQISGSGVLVTKTKKISLFSLFREEWKIQILDFFLENS